MNVQSLLSDAAVRLVDDGAPSSLTVRADLQRGRRALVRRRSRRLVTSALGLAVIASAGTAAVTLEEPVGRSGTRAVATSPSTVMPTVQLVSYTGTQPEGYLVDRVPSGWVLQTTTAYVLTITSREHAVDPQVPREAHEGEAFLIRGKLAVSLLSKGVARPTEGTALRVGATSGLLTHADPSGTRTLFYDDPATGRTVVVQVPAALSWNAQQIAEFATGIHVTAEAAAGAG